jgi:outer membrane protein OmpA-like peptidoglycan-associated protein
MRSRIYALICAIALSVIPSLSAVANVVGSDIQNFNANTSGIDFVTVHSPETLEEGIFNLGLIFNHAVNSLNYYEEQEQIQSRLKVNDRMLYGELLFGLGITDNFEIGFSNHYLLKQTVENNETARDEISSTGFTHHRFNAKYKFFKRGNFGMAGVASVTTNRIKGNPYLGKNQSPIYHLELVSGLRYDNLILAANIGLRFRDGGGAIEGSRIEPTPNQVIASPSISYLLPKIDTKLILESFGSHPIGSPNTIRSGRQASSYEGLAGIKYDHTTNVSIHLGGATEAFNGMASPDWRLYGGVNWTIGPVFNRSELAETPQNQFVSPPPKIQTLVYHVEFEFDSADLTSNSIKSLGALVRYAQAPPAFTKIKIEGHTDSVGSKAYNLELSKKRAQSVVNVLKSKYNLDANKIISQGVGESVPLADNGNYQGRKKNRRVEVTIFR